MLRTIVLAALLAATPALLGCLGDEPEPTPTTTVETLPPETVGEAGRPGRIAGIVTDAALHPIVGATVRLLDGDFTTRTRPDGGYAIPELTSGSYLVRIDAEGFVGRTFQTEVFRAQTTVLDAVLQRVPVATPFHETAELAGFISCTWAVSNGDAAPMGARCPIPDENERSVFEVPVAPDPARLVVEVRWEAQSELARILEVEIGTAMLGDQDTTFAVANGASVLRLDVPGAVMDRFYPEGGVLRVDVRVAPGVGDDEGVRAGGAFQQPFELFVTQFYVEPGPQDFSALASGA